MLAGAWVKHPWVCLSKEGDPSPHRLAQLSARPDSCSLIIYQHIGEDACSYAGLNCEREQSLPKWGRKKRGVLRKSLRKSQTNN